MYQNLPKQFFSSRNNTPPMKIKAFFSFIQVLDVKGRGNIHGITFGRNSHPTRGLCNSIFVFSLPRGGLFQFDLIFSLDLCGSNSIFVGPNSIFVSPSSPTRRRTLSIQLDLCGSQLDLCFLLADKRTLSIQLELLYSIRCELKSIFVGFPNPNSIFVFSSLTGGLF